MSKSKILILFLVLFACKKPAPLAPSAPIKYEPQPYFPVYPGSYWEYVDQNSIIKRYSTSDKYDLVYIQYTDSIILDPVLLPNYNGNYYLGYYQIRRNNSIANGKYDEFINFFSDELNKQFSSGYSYSSGHLSTTSRTNCKVQEVNKTINHPYLGIVDSIVLIDKLIYLKQNGYEGVTHEIEYYAKNIGMIRNCSINDISGDTIVISDLKSYFINH